MTSPITVPKGLAGVAVTETSISKSEQDGKLVYRGYSIEELAENSSFEETAFLVTYGYLPKKKELDEFRKKIGEEMRLNEDYLGLIKKLPKQADTMDLLRTAVSMLSLYEKKKDREEEMLSIASKMASIVANCYRISSGMETVQPREDLSFAENLLYMITSRVHEKQEAWIFERELIFYMEHDLNASSFTVRVVASTLSDPYSAVTAGIAALKGPLHGGANEAVMDYLLKLSEQSASGYVASELEKGSKIMGFGHRVYKLYDPRARLSKKYLSILASKSEEARKLYNVCEIVEREMWERKKIPANLDFYAGPIFYLLGLPVQTYTPIFASSRVFGWLAHYREQIKENKLYRPDAIYVGNKGLRYKKIEER